MAHTWRARGLTPVMRVPGRRESRVSVAALTCYRPGRSSWLIYRIHLYWRRKSEAARFTWRGYRDLIVMVHV
ncbi:hypothetical protein ABT340_14910 [Streptosporangium sp. NPDC000239]|uniref:hypothetical protein n=1 Tax=Streptosporangium sp. NPDC000239 TaxID=3154248 RepID=UPI003327428F